MYGRTFNVLFSIIIILFWEWGDESGQILASIWLGNTSITNIIHLISLKNMIEFTF